jgi:hypothetical protein
MRVRWCAPALPPARWTTCTLLTAAALATGCETAFSTYPPPPPVVQTGEAVMDWTIDGTKDPARCRSTGADTFHIALYNSGGHFAGEYVQDCTTFATSIGGLVPDTYTGQADLLDANGAARTTTVDLAAFDVIEGTSVTVGLDFPSNSFF